MLTALAAAAALAQASAPADGVRSGPAGAVVQGDGQAADILDPRYRPADRPAWGRPPEPCTVVTGNGTALWLPSGCVAIQDGLGNRINGRVFPPHTLVCVGRDQRARPCARRTLLDRLPAVRLPRLSFGR